MTKNPDVEYLKEKIKDWDEDERALANEVLYNPKFSLWPASIGMHQCEEGGLAKHTREIVDLCEFSSIALKWIEFDPIESFFSALYHDVGKLWDYEIDNNPGIVPFPDNKTRWKSSTHKDEIYHISRSALVWSHAVVKYPELNEEYHDKVLHNILAHHGRLEWKSPVTPKTKQAWLLHTCDMISARLDDYKMINAKFSKAP